MNELIIANQIKDFLSGPLSGSAFQDFGGKFASYYLPDIFPLDKTIPYSGANIQGVSTPGHPDAWSAYKDGYSTIEVCAINSKSRAITEVKKDVLGLKEDSISKKYKVTFLCIVLRLFVDKSPDQAITNDLKNYASGELDLDISNIVIITGFDIVAAISRDPRYAPLLSQINIPITVHPFLEIADVISQRKEPFPKPQDFFNGHVFDTRGNAAEIQRILQQDKRCLIWGNGGSGKTTIALLTAFKLRKEGYATLYIDLKTNNLETIIQEILDFLQKNAHEKMLVIFDNAHACQYLATRYSDIRLLQQGRGFQAIYLSRIKPLQETEEPEYISFSEAYQSDGGKNLHIVPGAFEFKDVVSLYVQKKKDITWKDPNIFTKLCSSFGHDLFIFAFSLSKRPAPIFLDDFTPVDKSTFDAIDKQYFKRFSGDISKLNAFIRLAALSALDVPSKKESFLDSNPYEQPFASEIAEGIVIKSINDDLMLPHSSLGEIIIRRHASHLKLKSVQLIAKAISECRFLNSDFFYLLEEQNKYQPKQLLREIFSISNSSMTLLSCGLILPTRYHKDVFRDGGKNYKKLLYSNPHLSVIALQNCDLTTLRNLLTGYSDPTILQKALIHLSTNIDKVWAQLKRTSPHIVKGFLYSLISFASDERIGASVKSSTRNFHKKLIDKITDPNLSYCRLLTNSKISLGYVSSLLDYIKDYSRIRFEQILGELLHPSNLPKLVKRGLSSQPDQFVKFLENCELDVGYKREQLIPYLISNDNLALVDAFMDRWQLNSTLYYLQYWEHDKCDQCGEYLSLILSRIFADSRKQRILNRLAISNIPQITSFFNYTQKAKPDFIEHIKTEIFLPRFINSVCQHSARILSNQLSKMLAELSKSGEIAAKLSHALDQKLTGSYDHNLKRLLHNPEIRDTVNFLRTFDNSREEPISLQLYTDLKNHKYFEKWLNSTIDPFNSTERINYHRLKGGNTTKIIILLKYLAVVDLAYLTKIENMLFSKLNSVYNLLLSEQIDLISNFISSIDELDKTNLHISDSLIGLLNSSSSLSILCKSSLKKPVSYLKSFLEFFVLRHIEFFKNFVNILNTNYLEALCNACATSPPHQLASLLKFCDKNHDNLPFSSFGILSSFEKASRFNLFTISFKKANSVYQTALTDYVKSKHNDIYDRLFVFDRISYASFSEIQKDLHETYKHSTLKTYLSRAQSSKFIYDAGKGWYSSIKNKLVLDTEPIKKIISHLEATFPLLKFHCWSTEQINSFTQHMLAKHITFVSTESDAMDPVSENLRASGYTVFTNPGKAEVEKFFRVDDKTVVVRPSISKQPQGEGHCAPIEKILVDLTIEAQAMHFMDESEARIVVENATAAGRVMIASLLGYAKRRLIDLSYLKTINQVQINY